MDAKDSVHHTALHVILNNCQKFPTKPALHWLDGNCKITEQYSYEEVEIRTKELAHGLLNLIQRKPDNSSDVLVRERAVLCYPPGLEFILTFLGCLRAGIIAVPVSPPNPYHPDYSMEMIVRIIHDCGAAFVLTSKEFAIHENVIEVIKTSTVPWHCEVDTEMLPEESSENETYQLLDQAKPEDIPFLQYTSGSTGTPKGVMPTHHTLLHNFQLMQEIMDTDSSMVEISFLPHYHAMGLICSYLQTLYHGGMGYFMSPVTFVENPGLWMKAFSLFHGTHAKAPNFAFDLVVRKGFPKTVDLSTARNIVSASEPVCIETIKEFESALALYGLKKNTVRAGYGLAEHTVYLTGVCNHSDPMIVDGRIGCGVPNPGVIIKVVDPETCTVMPEGEEGEIWVDSPSKALGYWEKEEKTMRIFEAQLNEISDRTYLRTGDLGFMKDGELFVSGRLKNVIIIHGRKIHPSDIEMRIESSFPMLQPGRTVACEYAPEHLKRPLGIAYIAEMRSPKSYSLVQLDSLSKQISTMIGLNFQIDVNLVAFINPHTLPCTMSGKRQRSLCKRKLVTNKLKEVYRWSRRSEAYQLLVPPLYPKADERACVMGEPDSVFEPESTIDTVQPILQEPFIDINVLEPSDSESNFETSTILESSSEPNSRNDTSSSVLFKSDPSLVTRDSTLKKLTVHYPEIMRTERRKSAPPIPVDRESRVKAANNNANVLRRKSTLDRTCSLSRLNKRRNSLQTLTNTVSGILGVQLQPDSNIWAHGCNSIKVHQLSQSLQSEFGFVVEPHHLFIHQTPKALLGKLQRSLLSMTSPPSAESNQSDEILATVDECGAPGLDTLHEDVCEGEDRGTEHLNTSATAVGHGRDIAIVGMACTFAGCNNTEELWELLVSKQVTTTSHFVPSSQQTLSGGFTPMVGVFDYNWFGVPEWEAASMDPQQSMLLHTAWECLENAATSTKDDKSLYNSDCGVFVGISMDNDAHFISRAHTVTPLPTSISSSVAANRIARAFNLKGPVMSIDTACASSLSALDVACKFLKDEDCGSALVCGVNAMLDPYRFTLLNKMGMLSPDEQCRVFDASSNGYVRGEGCGAVLLMPLSQAEKEGRRILAVVKSTVSNNNGALSATLTSPSGKDQETLITKALRKAHVSTKDVAYIEAHGTGTKLGDPIEVDAIQAVFGLGTKVKTEHIQIQMESREDKKMNRDCSNCVMVGSVKANIGHLETGAGIAGLIKSVMVLEHSMAPGNACLEKLNPCFRLSDNICISSENWLLEARTKCPPSPLAAVVNSFGFGGTNVAAVLQQYALLPHMIQSECTILFSIDAQCKTDRHLKDIAAAIGYLSPRFPAFQEAMTTCDAVIKQTIANLGEMCLDIERATVMKFYYALVSLCRALGIKFTIVGGLDIMGEVLSLVFVNSLELSHALIFILTSWPSAYACLEEELQKLIYPPTLPLFSCILEKVCYPSASPTEIGSSEYCMLMVSKLRAKNSSPQFSWSPAVTTSFEMERLLSIVESGNDAQPILSLMVDSSVNLNGCSKSKHIMINASEFNFTENGVQRVEHYIREKLIELRNVSDRVRMAKCVSRPTKSVENIMPDFHKRYPLRAAVDPQLKVLSQPASPLPPEGDRVQNKTSPTSDDTPQTPSTPRTPQTPSPLASKSFDAGGRNQMNERKLSTLSSSSSVESGYITQENSRELLATSVPPNTPISMSTGKNDSKRLEYKLDREKLALALKENQLSDNEYERWEVISNLMEEVKNDLDSSDISLEEFAGSGMYDLGLDSLNVMHTADFVNQTYDVKMTFSEVANHGTVGQLAAYIVEQSPAFKKVKARRDLSSLSSTLKLTEIPLHSSDLYPTLTKEGYYTEPPLKDLKRMQPSAHSHNSPFSLHLFVNDFVIGRKGVGKIVFTGETDLARLNLDKLVHIDKKAVHLHAGQPGSDRLNKPTIIHFENVFPQGNSKVNYDALLQTLQKYCMDAKPPMQFVSYETDFGLFTVKMEKFY